MLVVVNKTLEKQWTLDNSSNRVRLLKTAVNSVGLISDNWVTTAIKTVQKTEKVKK